MSEIKTLERQTAVTQARYDRIAPLYDAMEWFTERTSFQGWRKDLWSDLQGGPHPGSRCGYG